MCIRDIVTNFTWPISIFCQSFAQFYTSQVAHWPSLQPGQTTLKAWQTWLVLKAPLNPDQPTCCPAQTVNERRENQKQTWHFWSATVYLTPTSVARVRFSLLFVCLFIHMICQLMQLGSPNSTYKCSKMSPGNSRDMTLVVLKATLNPKQPPGNPSITSHNKSVLVFSQNTILPVAVYASHAGFSVLQCLTTQAMLATASFPCIASAQPPLRDINCTTQTDAGFSVLKSFFCGHETNTLLACVFALLWVLAFICNIFFYLRLQICKLIWFVHKYGHYAVFSLHLWQSFLFSF